MNFNEDIVGLIDSNYENAFDEFELQFLSEREIFDKISIEKEEGARIQGEMGPITCGKNVFNALISEDTC
jgi:hypothetical protein